MPPISRQSNRPASERTSEPPVGERTGRVVRSEVRNLAPPGQWRSRDRARAGQGRRVPRRRPGCRSQVSAREASRACTEPSRRPAVRRQPQATPPLRGRSVGKACEDVRHRKRTNTESPGTGLRPERRPDRPPKGSESVHRRRGRRQAGRSHRRIVARTAFQARDDVRRDAGQDDPHVASRHAVARPGRNHVPRGDSDTLLVSDSEVEEMSVYRGANLYFITRSGHLAGNGTTVDYSREPTGVGFDTNAGVLYVSDDDKDRVFHRPRGRRSPRDAGRHGGVVQHDPVRKPRP